MDRFIDRTNFFPHLSIVYLKSNMDRFIGLSFISENAVNNNLKSNMDRFIDHTHIVHLQNSFI